MRINPIVQAIRSHLLTQLPQAWPKPFRATVVFYKLTRHLVWVLSSFHHEHVGEAEVDRLKVLLVVA